MIPRPVPAPWYNSAMSPQHHVLITGMSGLIGGLVGRSLWSRCTLRALNRSPVDGVETVRADLNDLDAIRPAFDGIDAVVHLAAYLGDDPAGHLSTNITGTYHVFEAARAAGVRRVVYASTGAVVAGYEADEPYKAMVEARWDEVPADCPALTADHPVRPNGMYAATKLFGEALGRHYADSFGLSVICLRIGRVLDGDAPRDPREAAVFLSHRDAVQAVERCIDAPDDLSFAIRFAVSDNRGRFRDLEHARRTIGFVPRDGADWPL